MGPESPNFIEVPHANLPKVVIPHRPKGILPVPRTIFPKTRPDKGTVAYLNKTTPKPILKLREDRAEPLDDETKALFPETRPDKGTVAYLNKTTPKPILKLRKDCAEPLDDETAEPLDDETKALFPETRPDKGIVAYLNKTTPKPILELRKDCAEPLDDETAKPLDDETAEPLDDETKALFPETRPGKGTVAYLKKTTPKPFLRQRKARAEPLDDETKALQEWQAAMAAKRRSNLREGLSEIKERKGHYEERRAAAFKARSALRDQVLEKALRNDVRLTLPSVLSTMRLQEKGLPDPRREERLKEMRAGREKILKEQSEERQNMVHELYMSAGDFILTEIQLDRAIEEKFKEVDLKIISPVTKPPTVREMLVQKERISKGEGLNIDDSDNVILEVGGALTGGRMPVSSM